MIPLALYNGRARRPLVRIVPDPVYPGMWRLAWPDGGMSDMANLSRIKDAAIALCERGPPQRNRRCLDWKKDLSKTAIGGPPIRQNGSGVHREPPVLAQARP
jgi:hypothetical protein